jgi:hypothetical protein
MNVSIVLTSTTKAANFTIDISNSTGRKQNGREMLATFCREPTF